MLSRHGKIHAALILYKAMFIQVVKAFIHGLYAHVYDILHTIGMSTMYAYRTHHFNHHVMFARARAHTHTHKHT
jgi:hypothetical protein